MIAKIKEMIQSAIFWSVALFLIGASSLSVAFGILYGAVGSLLAVSVCAFSFFIILLKGISK